MELHGIIEKNRRNHDLTQGRGNYSMTFDHYEEVPKKIAEEIQAKKNG